MQENSQNHNPLDGMRHQAMNERLMLLFTLIRKLSPDAELLDQLISLSNEQAVSIMRNLPEAALYGNNEELMTALAESGRKRLMGVKEIIKLIKDTEVDKSKFVFNTPPTPPSPVAQDAQPGDLGAAIFSSIINEKRS
jgi:hypothetical protein